ncbi:toll/interleukin-1 receptor domain-containing protein [uncultured Methanobrevibacter sp.]|uniref:toll/interleukin-1 receptor domain-containing protein n=1 Tax=uncultured Methanobrevibacter sp. TaxID=253161 RepID=UPI0025E7F26F|nr:toll/interleukin-1 receptor domain-containing protein [uncultured Methanobrevibacter sp.]
MNHDVYICYDKKDEYLSDELYQLFEKNNINAWSKSKDMHSDESVDTITNAISESKCFVLLLGKSSNDTNYIMTELDIAFSNEIPIVVFDIDEGKSSKKLEFLIRTQKVIPSYPNSKKQLEKLVKETSDIVKKPVDKVKIDSKTVDAFEQINPKRKENKIKKYIAIAIPIVAALILIYFFVIIPTGQNTTSDGIFAMNMTKIEVNGNQYAVYGESYNMPSNPEKYIMNIRFYDKDNNNVFEVNSTADEFKKGIIWQGDLTTNNATHAEFKLIDLNNKVISQNDYVIS